MLKGQLKARVLAPVCAALPLLAACQAPPLQIRPVGTSLADAAMNTQRADADYASARSAIERRDYAGALEWLQSARARNPNDIRVLNAFGVVYDKLGRFDLSARYYAQALALDSGSDVVIRNMAYSRGLQARTVAAPVSWELADITPPPQPATHPEVTVTAIATATVAVPLRRSHVLTVVNATGHAGGEQPVFDHLLRLKWSLARHRIVSAETTARTVIRYAPAYRARALKLARTLPGRPAMIETDATDNGLQLVLGADCSTWRLPAATRG